MLKLYKEIFSQHVFSITNALKTILHLRNTQGWKHMNSPSGTFLKEHIKFKCLYSFYKDSH